MEMKNGNEEVLQREMIISILMMKNKVGNLQNNQTFGVDEIIVSDF